MLLILEKHASSSRETSPGSDEDSCEDFLQDKEDDCDDDDDFCYNEKRKNKTCNLGLPVQRDIEDITRYVLVQ
jgi:hypothetical protein